MLNEIEQCTEHIVGFAAEHGVNISQMAIAGTSAGGHLASRGFGNIEE
jgi:acetyl esterase/lipase